MRILSGLGRLTGLLALLLTVLAIPAASPSAFAQTGNSSIEVHDRICPEGYQGQDYFADCHDNAPDPGLPFTFSDGVTRNGTTNEDGDIGFANLLADTYIITGGAPGEFTDNVVYCSIGTGETSNQEPVDVEYVTGGIQISLAANTNVICDWYEIPQGGQEPAPTTVPSTEPGQTGDSSIEVHNRICPESYQGQDYFADCHGNAPETGLTFTFSDGVTRNGTTNEDGDIGFANLPADTYTITGGVPGEFADTVVYCSVGTEETSNQEQVPVTYVTGGIQLNLVASTNVICDWYNIPENLKGDVTPIVVPTQIPPTAVPTTVPAEPGRTLEIREGTCAPDGIGTVVVILTDLRSPEPATDFTDVIIAETSSSTVSISLDNLISADNVVVTYAEDDSSTPVACTAVAGPVNDAGELVLGLQEMDDSNETGIVYLVSANNGTQTEISVFLAKGLNNESAPSTPGA